MIYSHLAARVKRNNDHNSGLPCAFDFNNDSLGKWFDEMGSVENYRNVDFVSHFVKRNLLEVQSKKKHKPSRLPPLEKDADFLVIEYQGDSTDEDSE